MAKQKTLSAFQCGHCGSERPTEVRTRYGNRIRMQAWNQSVCLSLMLAQRKLKRSSFYSSLRLLFLQGSLPGSLSGQDTWTVFSALRLTCCVSSDKLPPPSELMWALLGNGSVQAILMPLTYSRFLGTSFYFPPVGIRCILNAQWQVNIQ